MGKLSRRQILGGAGAGLLLAPFFNLAMRREAEAAVTPVKRLLLFCTMGTNPSMWTPTVSGETISSWSAMTQPLSAIADNVVLVEGMPSGNPNDGHGSPDGLTGMGYGYYNGQLKISVDQFVANQLVAQGINRPIASLLLGGETNANGGSTLFYGGSSNGGNMLPTIGSPLSAYTTVFGGALPTGMSADTLLARRKSILDLVTAEATSLKGQLGATEGAKLDAHLDSIRQLENKLSATVSAAACMKPVQPQQDGTYTFQGSPDALAMNVVHQSIIANAFACDITRVAALEYGNDQYLKVNAPNLPYDDQHGGYIHSGASTNFKNLVAFEAYLAGQFVALVNQLKTFADPQDSSKTLFDTTLVAWCRDMGDAVNHDQKSMRFVLASGNGGYLKTAAGGRYIKSTERHERVLLNLCESMGITNYTGFGDPGLTAKTPLPDIAAG
ncbi:MAG TPA: DUF1552 domain-containing protein [Polyangiaceae bacterium]|nr:DUF1552 domain-containing protein [Polyangiaceae bacterium]